MKTFFGKIFSGIKWVAVHFADIFTDLPKLITASHDIANDATTLVPDITLVIADCDSLVVAAVRDSGQALLKVEALMGAIPTAYSSKGFNIQSDEAVVSAFKDFITDVTNTSNFADVLKAFGILIKDFDVLKTTINADIAALKTDVAA